VKLLQLSQCQASLGLDRIHEITATSIFLELIGFGLAGQCNQRQLYSGSVGV